MTFKKWLYLFSTTIGLGGLVCVIFGMVMLLTDTQFDFFNIELQEGNRFVAVLVNMILMSLAGFTIGAFCHMGFFAYLTLNYIALSVFRKKYLWNAFQAYATIFTLGLLGYILYENKTNNWFFWVFPIVLMLASYGVARLKVKATKKEAFVPTMFLMIVITTILSSPVLKLEYNLAAIIFMVAPVFFCNFYQNHILGKLSKTEAANSTEVVKSAASSS